MPYKLPGLSRKWSLVKLIIPGVLYSVLKREISLDMLLLLHCTSVPVEWKIKTFLNKRTHHSVFKSDEEKSHYYLLRIYCKFCIEIKLLEIVSRKSE